MEDTDKSFEMEESSDDEDSQASKTSQLSTAKRHVCTYPGCISAFSKPSRLVQHVRIHTGEVSKVF